MEKWSALLLFSCLCQLGYAVLDIEKCIEELGCFTYLGAFYHPIYRPFAVLPSDRDTINTTFRLYTRTNPTDAFILDNRDPNFSLQDTPFNSEDETKFIIHGFRESEGDWMRTLRDEILRKESTNVVTVDWGGGSSIPYTLAATNTRVVGAELALLIGKLQIQAGADLKKVHIIGFSLGAHTAGYAGHRLKGQVRRITALDPAGPMFEGMPTIVRLDPSDAQFVDAIHTDAKTLFELSFGTDQAMGNLDFYPNNGHDQPDCPSNYFNKIKVITLDVIVKGLDEAGQEAGCRHRRSQELFIDSVRNEACLPVGFPCKNYRRFSEGKCATCGVNGTLCGVMGFQAEELQPFSTAETEQRLYLNTGNNYTFCRYHYQVVLSTAEDDKTNPFGINIGIKTVSFGFLNATIEGENGQSMQVDLSTSNTVFEPETDYTFLVTSRHDLGTPKSLSLTFTSSNAFESFIKLKWKVRNDLRVRRLKVTSMNRLKSEKKTEDASKYCSNTNSLPSGRKETFNFGGRC